MIEALSKTLSLIIRIILLAFLIAGLIYLGACIYGNVNAARDSNPGVPSPEKAQYSFTIKNTGNILLSSEYEQLNSTPGQRVFILKSFYELRGNRFELMKPATPLVLSEAVFGSIEVRKRQ